MNPPDDLTRLEGWSGDINELARMAGEILAARGLSDAEANVRVIRDYAQRGIVSRGERQGKEAIYGYRQLLELVAARVLIADGWPLAKIAEQLALSPESGLRTLIPGPASQPRNRALELARRLKGEALVGAPRGGSPGSSDVFRRRAAHLSSQPSELREALRRLGLPESAPAVESMTLIAVAPWCQVFLESQRLSRLTIEEAEAIGRAVAASLLTLLKKGKQT